MSQNDPKCWPIGAKIGKTSPDDKPRYMVLDVIKKGGMSKVYKVKDLDLQKIWCYKEIIQENNFELNALLSEAMIMRKLNHPSIPRITWITSTNGPDEPDNYNARIAIVMDWVSGENLQDVIVKTSKISVPLAVGWGQQIARILEYLHQDTREDGDGTGHAPILYRDLKPLNIIVDQQGKLNILDFGISIELLVEGQPNPVAVGTQGYAPPEMYAKNTPLDLRSDIYTLGATLYHMITGKAPPPPPIPGRDNSKLKKRPLASKVTQGVSPELDALIEKAMAINPEDRYSSVTELRMDLDKVARMTEETKKGYQRKIAICFMFLALSFFCMIAAMFPFMKIQSDLQANYNSLVEIANSTKDPEDYKKAIASRPNMVGPYIGLIEALEQDGIVTDDELMTIKDYLFTNKESMTDQEDYGKLCYDMGMMYWYYYDSTGKTTRSEVSAISWFEEAEKAGYEAEKAKVYIALGEYWKVQSKSVQISGSKVGENLRKYWDNLLRAKTFVKGEDEILQYQIYNSIAECIYNYSYQLVNNNVTPDELEAEVKELQAFIRQVSGDVQLTQKAQQLYIDLKAKVPDLSSKIKTATRGETYE